MNESLLNESGIPEEEGVAADSTGFSPGPANSFYQSRSGNAYRHWAKVVYAVGIVPQFILAMPSGWGPGSDPPYLGYLRRKARRFAKRRAWVLLADSGFDGKTVRNRDLIPPIRRSGNLLNRRRRARANLVSAARLDDLYGQCLEDRSREFSDQTQIRASHPLAQTQPAKSRSANQRTGLQHTPLSVPNFLG